MLVPLAALCLQLALKEVWNSRRYLRRGCGVRGRAVVSVKWAVGTGKRQLHAIEPEVIEQLRVWSVELADEADAAERRAAENRGPDLLV